IGVTGMHSQVRLCNVCSGDLNLPEQYLIEPRKEQNGKSLGWGLLESYVLETHDSLEKGMRLMVMVHGQLSVSSLVLVTQSYYYEHQVLCSEALEMASIIISLGTGIGEFESCALISNRKIESAIEIEYGGSWVV
ncbi:hypothetical protein STEG23_004021, partial [Scotinomys teguina]